MFKDFTDFNERANQMALKRKALMSALIDGQRAVEQMVARIINTPQDYADDYNAVQIISYDQDGKPFDDTPDERLSVPENRLAKAKAQIESTADHVAMIREELTGSHAYGVRNVYITQNGHTVQLQGIGLSDDDATTIEEVISILSSTGTGAEMSIGPEHVNSDITVDELLATAEEFEALKSSM